MARLVKVGIECNADLCDADAFWEVQDMHRRLYGSFCLFHGEREYTKQQKLDDEERKNWDASPY